MSVASQLAVQLATVPTSQLATVPSLGQVRVPYPYNHIALISSCSLDQHTCQAYFCFFPVTIIVAADALYYKICNIPAVLSGNYIASQLASQAQLAIQLTVQTRVYPRGQNYQLAGPLARVPGLPKNLKNFAKGQFSVEVREYSQLPRKNGNM